MNNSEEMSLVEHLGELRRRIFWVLLVLAVAMVLGLLVSDKAINYLRPAGDITWHALSPWDSVRTYMQFSFFIGFMLTLPVLLYHIWAFVKPGLRPEEQRATLKYIPVAFLLFLVGLSFSYFVVFKMALRFTNIMTERLALTETYGITQYFSFMFNILWPVSVLFELPVVVMFLTAIRILNPQRMRKMRRYAYFILLIVSAIVTPPDILSALIVLLPLILLYEASVLVSGSVFRKQQVRDRAWEAEYGAK